MAFDEQQGGGGLVGETFRILNGNTIAYHLDVTLSSPHSSGLSFAAAYNSQNNHSGPLGYGWSHSYSVSLDAQFSLDGVTYLKIVDSTGRVVNFKENSPGLYKGAFHEKSTVRVEDGDYVWYRLNDFQHGFTASGRL